MRALSTAPWTDPVHRGPCLAGLLALGACGLSQPPLTPDPARLGCYRLDTNLPASYADSLGYAIPDIIQLGFTSHGQWTVAPTDPDWHPTWSLYDVLPSGYIRRQRGLQAVSSFKSDSVARIPGDSLDITFPGPIGSLTLRLGDDSPALAGRAEWVVGPHESSLNPGVRVRALPSSCEGIAPSLRRHSGAGGSAA